MRRMAQIQHQCRLVRGEDTDAYRAQVSILRYSNRMSHQRLRRLRAEKNQRNLPAVLRRVRAAGNCGAHVDCDSRRISLGPIAYSLDCCDGPDRGNWLRRSCNRFNRRLSCADRGGDFGFACETDSPGP